MSELWHKYDFRGEIRFYRNRLRYVDPYIVWYMGKWPKPPTSHWDVKTKEQEEREDENWPLLQKAKVGQRLIYLADGKELHFKTSKTKDYFKKILRIKEVKFIGETNFEFPISVTPKEKNKVFQLHHVATTGLTCCYCECDLVLSPIQIPTQKTRDHIIPKHKGGKILKYCCYACNNEKGGLDLPVYIQMLCYQQSKVSAKSDEFKILQTKIINANKIAIEIGK